MEHSKCDFDFRLVYENGVMDIVRYVPAGEGGVFWADFVFWYGEIRHVDFHFLYIYLKFVSIARNVSDVFPNVCVGPLKGTYYFFRLNN
jgi:hypothetical protein